MAKKQFKKEKKGISKRKKLRFFLYSHLNFCIFTSLLLIKQK